ncbi:KSR2 Kinase, partial [Alaudala cheleensis]|nr:KSR2 Kinase [Alaudala cheleensis]
QSKLVKYFSRQLSCKRKVALQERNAKLEGFPQLLHWFRIVDIRKEVMEEIAPGQLSLEDLLDMTDDQVCATVEKFGANSEECARLNASLSCLRSVHKSGGSLSKQDWTIQWPSTEPGKENSPGCAAEPGPWGRTHPSPKAQPKCGQHHCHAASSHGPVYTHVDRLTVEGHPGLCPPLESGHRSLPPSPRQRHAAHTPPRTPNIVTTMTPPGTPPVRRRNKLKPPGTPPPSSRKLIHLIPGFTALHRSKSHEFQLGHRVDEAHTPNPKSSFSAGKHQAGPKDVPVVLKVTWGSSQCHPEHAPSVCSPHSQCWLGGGTLLPTLTQEGTSQREPPFLGTTGGSLLPEPSYSRSIPSCAGCTSGSSLQPQLATAGSQAPEGSQPGSGVGGQSFVWISLIEPARPGIGGENPNGVQPLCPASQPFLILQDVLPIQGCGYPCACCLGIAGSREGSLSQSEQPKPCTQGEKQGKTPSYPRVAWMGRDLKAHPVPHLPLSQAAPSPLHQWGFFHNLIVPDALCPPQNEEGAEEVQESEDDFEEMNLSLLSARNFPRKASQTSIFLQEWDIPFEQLEIGELIGKGRFGQVFHGRWHGEVAIRLIDIERDNEDQLKAFKREVMAYRQTRHENVVLFMGACMSPPHLAIITSLCKGRTLYSVVRDAKIVLDVNKTRQIAQEIVKGMGYLHAKGILHKDLKSKNVFYDNGKVVITDFGLFSISGVLQAGRRENKLRIQNGWLCHLAPEIIRQLSPDTEEDKLPFSKHSDVFALGTIWYELHAREWPFKTQPAEAIIWQVGRGMKPNLSQIGMGKEISDILLFCWAYEQEERPTFTKLMDMLEKLPKRNRRLSHPGHFWKSAE